MLRGIHDLCEAAGGVGDPGGVAGGEGVEVFLLVLGFEEAGEEVTRDDGGEGAGVGVFIKDGGGALLAFGRGWRHEGGLGGFADEGGCGRWGGHGKGGGVAEMGR